MFYANQDFQFNLDKVDAKEDGDAVKAVTDVTVGVLHQQLNCLPEDVVEDILGGVGVQHEELGHKEKLPAGVVHQRVLEGPKEHLVWKPLLRLLTGVRHDDGSLELRGENLR